MAITSPNHSAPEDRGWVEAVTAFVALRPGQTVRESELIAFAASKVASYKKPRFVEFVETLPRTPVGFVDYRALDSAFGGGNYPGGALRGS